MIKDSIRSNYKQLLAVQGATNLSIEDATAVVEMIMTRHGCSKHVGRILADNCVSAERDGIFSHGLFRIEGYVKTLKSGWVDGTAKPSVEDVGPSLVRVDAKNGFAQVALDAATPLLLEKAKSGVAVLATRDSHHFGALSLDVEPFAEKGLIALSVVNSMRQVAPFGATNPIFGTNPIAFAAPRRGRSPIVFDLATSTMSNGDVQIAAREGRVFETPAGIDKDGILTNDPAAILAGGALIPFGGHKGASISLMVEILCAAFVGGQFSHEVDHSGYPGAETPRTGQTVIVLNPAVGGQVLPEFVQRIEMLFRSLDDSGVTRLPGEKRLPSRTRAKERGLALSAQQITSLRDHMS